MASYIDSKILPVGMIFYGTVGKYSTNSIKRFYIAKQNK